MFLNESVTTTRCCPILHI